MEYSWIQNKKRPDKPVSSQGTAQASSRIDGLITCRFARIVSARGARRGQLRLLGRTRWAPFHDVIDLLGINGFPFKQRGRHGFNLVTVLFDQTTRQRVLLV